MLLAIGLGCGLAWINAPVLRATTVSACFISATVRKRLSGLYSNAILTTASISGETFELMRRMGRSENENGGSSRGSRRVRHGGGWLPVHKDLPEGWLRHDIAR